MTRHVAPHAWRNLVLASAIGYSPDPIAIPLCSECGADLLPGEVKTCGPCLIVDASCRWCGVPTLPEEERCCSNGACESAERADRRNG